MQSTRVEDQLAISFDPVPARTRASGALVSLIVAVAFGLLSTAVVLVVWLLVGASSLLVTLALVGIVAIASIALRMLWWVRLRADAQGVGEGLALILSRAGVATAAGQIPWANIDRVAVTGNGIGRSPRLQFTRAEPGEATQTPIDVPLNGLDVSPAVVDSAVRAYSGGRLGVDLRQLDD
ncbi:hypothetical protein [Granulicoccus phenolivorans]|uniref:hypothetical protein n=1 Tax=Granulicoccus phenolivorans TaxID=266854 RepID=UPI0003F7633C|nr:hypothetical protein [Granulicoccus phenolivorans]